jgi:glycosyltransferase involved in cell wall biosynthesis
MSRRDTVVFLVPGFPQTEAETDCLPFLQNFVKAIARRNPGVDFHVIAFQYPFTAGKYSWNGVTVHALAGLNRRFPLRLRTWIQAAMEIKRLRRSANVISLHSFWLAECTFVASWISRASGMRHIATIAGQDALDTNRYLKLIAFDRMVLTSMSQNAAGVFFQSTGCKVDHIIPIGLDVESMFKGDGTSDRSVDILGVGSLSPVKNFRLFVEIIARLKPRYPALRCMIVGEGPERQSLERQIRDEGLSPIIEMTRHLAREDVLRTMRKSKILLHTANYEGQGYVFLEALGAGMRVVSFDVGHTGTSAAVYRCKSAEEIVQVLQTLLESDPGSDATHVESVEDTARAFEKIYGIA